jgi:glycosyltransferase involved in cell wall biosynthesis
VGDGGALMRVLIDTTYAHRAPRSGTAVYLEQLLRALGPDAVPVWNRRRGAPAGGGLRSVRNLLADRWWEEVELPRLARAHGAEVIHHPLPAVTRRPRGARVVITVHDLAFERLPEMFDPRFRRYAHRTHRDAARAADAVICVSETTADDVRQLWGVPAERIVVARHGPGQQLPALPRAATSEHFLYVGDAEPRKDLVTLLAAHERYRARVADPLPLVCAGAAGEVAGPERLAELYAGAAALVHPSLYEGFGMTLLEAMTAGTPVIAARAAGAVEVCGDAASWFEPGSVEQLADAIAGIGDGAERSARGRARAAEFSWAASARAHLAAYSLAINR